MLEGLQLLSFEIGRVCNLAGAHRYCPVNHDDRHRQGKGGEALPGLTDDEIIDFARVCLGAGFQGLVAWHYYNEPMLSLPRILRLGLRLRDVGLGAMAIWTNGELIDREDLGWLDAFAKVYITDHNPSRRALYQSLVVGYPGRVHLKPGGHDCRADVYAADPLTVARPCYRPQTTELVVDYVGDLHLCCTDWRAECWIGNVRDDREEDLLERWGTACAMAEAGQLEICKKCQAMRRHVAIHSPTHRL